MSHRHAGTGVNILGMYIVCWQVTVYPSGLHPDMLSTCHDLKLYLLDPHSAP